VSSPRFQCLKSGDCCTHLLNEVENFGVTNGLLLLAIEKDLFPKHLVKPQWGLGGSTGDEPEQIVTYQLTENACPFYDKERGCMIRDKRPLICRAFPILLLSWERRTIGVSGNCRWVKQHFGGRIPSHLDAPPELSAVGTLASILSLETEIASSPRNYWNYDLKTGRWKLLGSPSSTA
jgi:Fe-S-cluster containining protein